ncbi:hypothetical protein Bca101_062221 [Brassica carinata]
MESTGKSPVSDDPQPNRKNLSSSAVSKKPNGSPNKVQYSVADHSVTISFGWNSVLSVLTDSPVPFHEDRFRFRSHEEFEANCDLKGGLYDYLGHMKLVNGQPLTDCPMLDEVEIAKKRHLMVHVQIHGGPLVKLYIWDKAAADFCQKYKSYGRTPSAILVTTLNPKRIGGTFALATMSSSRVFMDTDVQPTRDYLSWLASNSDIALKIDAEIVTKPEAVTIAELFTYIKKENAKVAWFECTATIDHVVSGAAWYLTKISVYDKSDQAVFVILGDAGFQLTGHHTSELVANHFESNENIGDDQIMPVPQALTDTSGQTHKFLVKVSKHNLQGLTQSITVTKILPPEAPEDNANTPNSAEILDPVGEETGASMNIGDSSTEGIKRSTRCSTESSNVRSG